MMVNIREALRLIESTNFSNRAIGRMVGMSHNTIRKYRRHLREKAFCALPIEDLSDAQLHQQISPNRGASTGKRMPDWGFVHSAMQARHQTLIQLWEEYCVSEPATAYCYSQFTHYYRKYLGRIDVTMRQVFYAGEIVFVDYAGRTLTWRDGNTGAVHTAQIFIGVLACSNYSFVWASPSQKLEDWIDAHVHMFEFFGGVPQVVVSDNLRSAVSRAGLFPVINRTYLECIRHYHSAVDPTRVRKPRDKAKVEAGVLFVSRWILTQLSRQTFFSIDEINSAIAPLLEKFNRRPFKRLSGSRLTRFEELDKPYLKLLPEERFEYAEWVGEQKVPADYHVYVRQHAYSVPFQFVGEKVEARVTRKVIELYHSNKRIAVHARSEEVGGFTTSADHRPAQHKAYISQSIESFNAWAQRIGPSTTKLVEAQFEGKPEYSLLGRKACMQLEKLCRTHGDNRFEAACARAIEIGSLTVKSVRSILQHNLDFEDKETPIQSELPLNYHLRGAQYYISGGLLQ